MGVTRRLHHRGATALQRPATSYHAQPCARPCRPPRTFFFAGKAAPAYHAAKLIIKLINNVKAILNVAAAGRFSSDRTIAEYATQIWGVKPCPVR